MGGMDRSIRICRNYKLRIVSTFISKRGKLQCDLSGHEKLLADKRIRMNKEYLTIAADGKELQYYVLQL